jgi:hypothetical protein
MAASFDPDTLQTLDRADEIDIETSRGEGAAVHRVTIWIVVDGETAYMRSVRGPAGRWYRELSANPKGAIHVDGRRIPIEAEPATDAESVSRVSDALRRKYAQRWPGPLAGMLREQVLPTTMRVKPA